MTHDSSLLDADRVRLVSSYDPQGFQELVDVFRSETDRHLAALQLAVDRRDVASAREAIHVLKGASANLGAAALEKAAEGALTQKPPLAEADLAPLLRALRDGYARTLRALQEWDVQS